MAKKTNIFFGLAILAAGIFFLGKKAKGVKNIIDNIVVQPLLLSKPTISWSKIKIPFSIRLTNPTSDSFGINLKGNGIVMLKGKEIAQFAMPQKSIDIRPNASVQIDGLEIEMTLGAVGQMLDTAITSILGGDWKDIFKEMTGKFTVSAYDMASVDLDIDFKKLISSNVSGVGGLGLVATSKRNIRPLSDYANLIPPKNELDIVEDIVRRDASVPDTVRFMHEVVRKTLSDTKRLAYYLKGADLRSTLNNIWNFVYTHIDYVRDESHADQVRRPLRSLYDQKGDCDCFSTLIGSMLTNLGIPFSFRVAEYNNKGFYQHVYVVVPHNGNIIVVDPVLDKFNMEKDPTHYMDFPNK